MTNLTRKLLPLLALALALAGCVAYPGYYGPGYGYAPTVAVAVPCCAYGGGGWHGGGGYGYHHW